MARPRRLTAAFFVAASALLPFAAQARCFTEQGGGKICETLNQASKANPVAPNDNADLPGGIARALRVGGTATCNITMVLRDDPSARTWNNIAPGEYINAHAKRVYATGTTCSDILALY